MRFFSSPKRNIEKAYDRYGSMLYRLALTHLGNDADAQDAVQDAFLRYMTAAPDFESKEHEKAWLLRVTVNRCHDLAAKREVRSYLPLEEAYGLAGENGDGVRELLSLVKGLPDLYREVIILHALEGFTLEETADILEISLSAAKMRFARAKETLNLLRKEET